MKMSEMKKAYKKYAKENKTQGYKISLTGTIIVVLGAIIALPVAILSLLGKIDIVTHFTYIIPSVVIVIIGMVLDAFGEVLKSKEMKEFSKNNEK